jgi:FMN phosphatase YigB (HAD superfamily)
VAVRAVFFDVGETLVDETDLPAARAAGMVAVHVRRAPWGYLQGGPERAHIRIGSLRELPEGLAGA